ncbi:39S ribosomal protein L1, mitochondrial [Cyclopterus lumpus]|uniref:39S ribosomal protein L1, mitochondrial n=1 Tax=Cyclopterus lumpus TaxID=8103 RepID=UPI001486BADC|nr:39S ribosomal protein L1, mitochondrial [Cyclopterus lumpus]
MATCTRTVWKVLAGCQRQLLRAGGPPPALRNPPVRTLAAVKALRKDKKEDKEKEAKKERTVVDDKDRHKPFGKTAWTPVDDVYFMRYYPRTLYGAADAVDLLKDLQKLDFTPQRQPVYIDLRLDMKLEKKGSVDLTVLAYMWKKRVDSFVSTVHLPHPFKTEKNTVLVFTEDPLQAQVAKDSGAAFAGGAELVQSILDDEVSADFYVAVPDMLPKLLLLKNKLRKKFPKSKRGSVGVHIPKMVSLFQTGHEVTVEDERYVRTQIGLLDMPTEELLSNLQTVLLDVCSHRPAGTGPLIERAIIASQTSEALWFKSEDLLPKPAEQKDV